MRRFLFLLIFGILGTSILIGLGSWQMRRLAWKEAILTEIETRIATAPVALPATPDRDADRYRPVQLSGRIEPGELHVLVSRKRIGAGFLVVAPYVTDDGRRVLLDRGFVRERDKTTPRQTGAMAVTGHLHWPRETDGYTPAPDLDKNFWFARDVDAMAQALETEPMLIVAASDTGAGITPLPVGTEGIPNNHLQYAITWFSLALIWAAMTSYFLWRSRARSRS